MKKILVTAIVLATAAVASAEEVFTFKKGEAENIYRCSNGESFGLPVQIQNGNGVGGTWAVAGFCTVETGRKTAENPAEFEDVCIAENTPNMTSCRDEYLKLNLTYGVNYDSNFKITHGADVIPTQADELQQLLFGIYQKSVDSCVPFIATVGCKSNGNGKIELEEFACMWTKLYNKTDKLPPIVSQVLSQNSCLNNMKAHFVRYDYLKLQEQTTTPDGEPEGDVVEGEQSPTHLDTPVSV